MNIIKINDVVVRAPNRGFTFNRSPQIKKMTNAKGEIVAQQINNKNKLIFKNLEWRYISREEWELILSEIIKVNGTITFYDSEKKKYVKYEVLFEDIEEVPYLYNDRGEIIKYSSCSCAVTDTLKNSTEVEEDV